MNRQRDWPTYGQHFIAHDIISYADFVTGDEAGFFAIFSNGTWPAAGLLISWTTAG